jgi:hypothetical protein
VIFRRAADDARAAAQDLRVVAQVLEHGLFASGQVRIGKFCFGHSPGLRGNGLDVGKRLCLAGIGAFSIPLGGPGSAFS